MRTFILLFTLLFSLNSLAGALPDSPHLYVKGVGVITVKPDIAQLHLSINFTNKNVIEAKKQSDSLAAKVIKIAEQYKIDKKDISASELNIHRETEYHSAKQKQIFIGYQVNRNISLKIRNLDQYTEIMQTLINSGVNEVGYVTLLSSKEDELRQQAKEKAIKDVKNAVKSLARSFDVKVGDLYRVSESPIKEEDVYAMKAMVRMREAPANIVNDSFEPGNIEIEETIYAVYLID